MNQAKGQVRKTSEDAGIVGDSLGPQGGTAAGAGRPGEVGDLAGIATGAASDIANAAVEQGRQMFESARGQATGFADRRKDDAAQSIADIASSLRETGKSFGDRPNIASFVGTAADGLEQLAGGIKERSFADLYGEAEDFARRQPLTFGAVALLAGFVAARFIKSSAEELSDTHASRRDAGQGGRSVRGGTGASRTAAANT